MKLLMFLPLFHIFGLVASYFWFAFFGRTFVFLSDYSPNTILSTIRRHKVTHLFAVPLLWDTLAKEIKKEVLFIDESIEESTLLLYNQMEEKHINVDINLDHIQVIASKELIKEVWINILNNAIKYTNEFGEINIYSTILDDGYLFSFKDNGIGMNDEIKEHIFDEYYQGNTTNKNQGIGLGLSICKKIIELHNWEITVTSELGKGTTFNIFIPKEK